MKKEQLEHLIRAAASITNQKTFIILGSQAIHGTIENPPPTLELSREADIFPLKDPAKTDLINGTIGEITLFDDTFGYYAHGIPPETCALPTGWKNRLHLIQNENTNGAQGFCLDPHDLACAKLAAGRPKDIDFTTELLRENFCDPALLKKLIQTIPEKFQKSAATNLGIILARVELTPPPPASIEENDTGTPDIKPKPEFI
jgi:hypothetical protein